MSVFRAAVDAIFGDANMAETGHLVSARGYDVGPVRVMWRRPDETQGWTGASVVSDALVAEIRVSEAPDLARDDTLHVGGSVYRITGEPVRDAERLVWTAEARAL